MKIKNNKKLKVQAAMARMNAAWSWTRYRWLNAHAADADAAAFECRLLFDSNSSFSSMHTHSGSAAREGHSTAISVASAVSRDVDIHVSIAIAHDPSESGRPRVGSIELRILANSISIARVREFERQFQELGPACYLYAYLDHDETMTDDE